MTTTPILFSIDPGVNGYICLWQISTKSIIDTLKLPICKNPAGDKVLDHVSFIQLLDQYQPAIVVVELTGLAFKAGKVAIHNMAALLYTIKGICLAKNIPIEIIHPRTWQSKILVGYGSDYDSKQKSLLKLKELYPAIATKNDNLSDAILLGHYYLHYCLKQDNSNNNS